jgi:hypothetical protein
MSFPADQNREKPRGHSRYNTAIFQKNHQCANVGLYCPTLSCTEQSFWRNTYVLQGIKIITIIIKKEICYAELGV